MSRLCVKYIVVILTLTTIASAEVRHDRMEDMFRRLEQERETAILRNKILHHLESNGAKVNLNKNFKVDEPPITETLTQRNDEGGRPAKNEPLLAISQPASSKRDRCLVFKVSKIKDNVGMNQFSPFRMNLWMYLRKTSKTKKNKKKKDDNERVVRSKDVTDIKRKIENRIRKRKKKGRRIKLFVTDGSKRLTTTRMNIRLKGWYKIELPISRFPREISENDSFKLCFKCKRCKRYKMVLYRKDSKIKMRDEAPKIPFIEFETVRSRSRRSINDVKINKRRHHHSSRGHAHSVRATNTSCCEENLFTQDITEWFPNILYPSLINFSTCGTTFNSSSIMPLLSQNHTNSRETSNVRHETSNAHEASNVDHSKCVPRSYENFSFLFIDDNSNFKTGDIPNLIPHGCVCQKKIS